MLLRVIFIFCCVFMSKQSYASNLDATLNSVLNHHPTLLGKQAEVKAAEYQMEAARAKRLPSLSLSVSDMNDDYEQGVLTINQPLYQFGNITANIDKSVAQVALDNADYLRVKRGLLEQASHRYNDYYYAEKVAELGALNVTEHQKLLEHIQRRLAGKLASEADVNLGKSRLSSANIQFRQHKKSVDAARNMLFSLTIEPVEVSEPVPVAQWEHHLQAGDLVESILDIEPEILVKYITIEVYAADLAVRKTENLPTINLRAEHNFLDEPIRGDKNRIGLVLESNLDGLGFVGSNNAQAAQMDLLAAKKDYAATKTRVNREVLNLIEEVTAYYQIVEQQQHTVDLVRETFDSYFRQYRSGRKSWLDVINIQRELTEQRIQLLEMKRLAVNAAISIAARSGEFDTLSRGK